MESKPAKLRMLFVCTANISRSPYAERRARQVVDAGDIEAASAGIPGYPGRPMDPEMARLLDERGGDASGHVSRVVTQEVLAGADLIIPFEFSQHLRLLDSHPEFAGKILGFGQLVAAASRLTEAGGEVPSVQAIDDLRRTVLEVAGANSTSRDVADPYGRGARAAQVCADQIDESLDALLPWITGTPVPPLAAPVVSKQRRRRWLSFLND